MIETLGQLQDRLTRVIEASQKDLQLGMSLSAGNFRVDLFDQTQSYATAVHASLAAAVDVVVDAGGVMFGVRSPADCEVDGWHVSLKISRKFFEGGTFNRKNYDGVDQNDRPCPAVMGQCRRCGGSISFLDEGSRS